MTTTAGRGSGHLVRHVLEPKARWQNIGGRAAAGRVTQRIAAHKDVDHTCHVSARPYHVRVTTPRVKMPRAIPVPRVTMPRVKQYHVPSKHRKRAILRVGLARARAPRAETAQSWHDRWGHRVARLIGLSSSVAGRGTMAGRGTVAARGAVVAKSVARVARVVDCVVSASGRESCGERH
jgi:hypothetical protein